MAARSCTVIGISSLLLASSGVHAALINVGPSDTDAANYAKLEGAGPGDEVVIAPGTYRFRVYLQKRGTAAQPIIIRAKDPSNRPVWDLSGQATASWPGSYTRGDRGRGAWQVSGAYYHISGIVFRGASDITTGDSSGLRFQQSDHVSLSNCLFQMNDNGVEGAGTASLIEYSEFDRNGTPGTTDASHNVYIHGGDITVRYSYIHDARAGQNLHIRANNATFEYNWIARSKLYMGDMMPCTDFPRCNANQYLTLRGNVVLRGSPQNDSQEFVLYNDQGTTNPGLHLTLINNTFVGNGDNAALVALKNANATPGRAQSVVLDNNVVYNFTTLTRAARPGMANTSIGGTHNWLSANTRGAQSVSGSVVGADPGFRAAGANDFRPAAGSPLVGRGDTSRPRLPVYEYYRDEVLSQQRRRRVSALDIGAFESRLPPE